MTNEQAVLDAEAKADLLKKSYVSFLNGIIRERELGKKIDLEKVLKCQQLGSDYFNYVENFVGSSGLLGAHANGRWVTGFAETCHSVLMTVIFHHQCLNSYSQIAKVALVKPNPNSYANMQRMVKEYLPRNSWKSLKRDFLKESLPVAGFSYRGASDLKTTPKWQLVSGIAIGIFFALLVLFIVILIPNPTPTQFFTFRAVFALSMSAIAAIIPGFLNVESRFNSLSIKATGAIAVFIVVYLLNPPALI